jgi:DDE family transposase
VHRLQWYHAAMYIESVPNRGSPPAILLRESYREGGRVRKRTLLNLSDWPPERIAGFKALLKGGRVVAVDPPAAPGTAPAAITILRSLPHGHVAAALGTARKIGLDRLIGPNGHRCRDLVLALAVARVLDPTSKLAAARALSPETAASSLGSELALGAVDEEELYRALDWLLVRQPWAFSPRACPVGIERALARRHLSGGTLVLYDVTSSYLEGRCCPLARFGYNRDGKPGKLQIVYGLLCAADGCPVAVEVFDGDTADPATLGIQVKKLKERFGLDHVVLVGDRGMITSARIAADLKPAGLDWITALRAPQIRALTAGGALQMSLFDERDMASITAPDYPGERLIVCRNPALAGERARKREELLAATERDLGRIAARAARRRQPLRGRVQIGLAVGAVIDKHNMAKHFTLTIRDTEFTFTRKAEQIAAEAALDGLYAVRTSLPAATLDDRAAVRSYKSLALVERAFRALKTVDLMVRPVYHWLAERVRAHVFLCLLAYYLEWHMRRALAPMLYDETDRATAEQQRVSIVAPAERSPAARAKQTTGCTADGLPVHSFRTLLADLATLTRNTLVTADAPAAPFAITTRATPIQQKAFILLRLASTQ